jgi:hypothetical protein
MHLFRIADGRIAEHWHVADIAGMLRQLGATPPAQGDAEASRAPAATSAR